MSSFVGKKHKWICRMILSVTILATGLHVHGEAIEDTYDTETYEETSSQKTKDKRMRQLKKELQELRLRLSQVETQLAEQETSTSPPPIAPLDGAPYISPAPTEIIEENVSPETDFSTDMDASPPQQKSQSIEWKQGVLPEKTREEIFRVKEVPATLPGARKALENGQIEEAKKMLHQISQEVSHPEAPYLLGIIALWSDKAYGAAYKFFVSAYALSQQNQTHALLGLSCLVRMAEALYAQGKKPEAHKVLLHYHKKADAFRKKNLSSEAYKAFSALEEDAKTLEKKG